MPPGEKVCIIGAGSSGIVACQVLNARRISFDCFEKGSAVGGNWRYENDNGMSSAYRSLHINTSRRVMAFKTFPMPDHYPDYPDHFQMAAYFDEYVDHFGLRDKIRFRTEVLSVEPVGDEWEVTVEGPEGKREASRYRAVLVANGHHWDPRWPEPAFPGADEFSGEQIHAHHYREPDVLPGKRVLVLGLGNSATDIAVESSRIADATFLATRRGAYVLPKYMNGKPIDEVSTPVVSRLPMSVQRFFSMRMLGVAAGDMTAYGLPKPDHKLFEAHPTVSSELLPRLGHGDIKVKPNIARFTGGRGVRFVDGSEEEIDLVVYCTGYKMTFPFFAADVFSAPDNRLPLYRRVASVERPGLYFIGFIQPLGPIMPLAEAQAEWVADLLGGRAALPAAAEMRREIASEEGKMRKRFVASKRHTVEVDFHPYLREIRRERKQAAQRA
ncbi:MAG TPA: NAD(P)-binding domain-containing protein [Solirubrobacterales bacterium]|jgi:dimethylaniline monooxygenase (N-oxide forming)|nr:NAD(P)-binding domain-containing protein [Solirubrobacterales bacterium]